MIDDLELVNRIYEAAVIPEMWPAVLDDLSKIATRGGTLLSIDPQQEVRHIASEQFRGVMELFIRDGWIQQNIRAEKFMQTKYAGFLTDTHLILIEDMDRHPFYTDLVRPNGGGFAIGTSIPVPSGDLVVFNLERSYAEGPVEKSLCARLDAFRPHLARAGLLSVRLRMERTRAMVDALEQIGLPAAVPESEPRRQINCCSSN